VEALYQSKFVRGTAPRAALAAILSAPLVLLTACGGGGGGGDAAPAPAPVTSSGTLQITTANAKPVSADALDNATNVDAAEGGASIVTGVQVDTGAAAGGSATLQLADAARVLAAKAIGRTSLATGAAVNESAACNGGGSVNISGNVASNSDLSPGDTITISASSCRETVNGATSTLNGSMKITIVSGSVNANPVHIVMTIESLGFSVSENGKTSQTNGDLTLDVTGSAGSSTQSVVLSGKSLSTSVSSAAGTRSFSLQNYRQSVSSVNGAVTYNVEAQVTTSNSRLGAGTQVYSVSTPTALTTNASRAYTGGSLKVTGKSSALLLTVTGTDTFQLQVDENGDGTFETTTPATLAELRALL
jgi:hypothetical protein